MFWRKVNGQKVALAGMSLLDRALNSTSTNGVQNKVITAAINGINQNLTDLTDDIYTRTLIDSKTGTNEITIPNGTKHIYVKVALSNGWVIYNDYDVSILNDSLESVIHGGYFVSGGYGGSVLLNLSKTKIKLGEVMVNSGNVTGSCTISVYS